MLTINKIRLDCTIDFAAEELKKYLRMMMPEAGDVKIAYNPDATDGFRLGLMQDFGLDISDAKDPELDDIFYIKCDTEGGIIAGTNPHSVLICVYEYLRQNGCRWLMPGVDGEFIPMQDIVPVEYRHRPTMRYRGWVSEGTEFQQSMVAAVDFAPKIGMNVFMIEFRFPKSYYMRYYDHTNNPHRAPESVTVNTILQWKRQLEAEISKRGLQYHDMGHGFTYEPFGIDALDGWNTDYESRVTPEHREMMAMINGERKIVHYPINTNFCMTNKKARGIVARFVVDYAKQHQNVDFLHVWLADANNNHCECPECSKHRPSDLYVTLLNEIDEIMEKEGVKTRIVFIAYMDTAWAPLTECIKNPDRFLLMLAPITRRYTETLPNGIDHNIAPYERNKLKMPASLGEYFGHFDEWKKNWKGNNISFEYHFWRKYWTDISGIEMALRLNEDVKEYEKYNIDGMLEDGTQRCFFPTGIALYSYARTLFDTSAKFDDIIEDYFSHIFGEDWKLFYDYLSELSAAFDFKYVNGLNSAAPEVGRLYNPTRVEFLKKVPEITAKGRELVRSHFNSDYRVQTVATRLLLDHADFADMYAALLAEMAQGNDDEARRLAEVMYDEMGKCEQRIEMYYDHCLMVNSVKAMINNFKTNPEEKARREIQDD